MTSSEINTKEIPVLELEAPRFQRGKPLLIAGLRGHFTTSTWSGIPEQWQRFSTYLGKIPGQIGRVTYGLCFNLSTGVDYLSGVEVTSNDTLPGEFSSVRIPAQEYAVFPHRGHVSQLRRTLEAVGEVWLPTSGREIIRVTEGAPDFFERYGESFDPRSGMGDIEVWMPISSGKRQ